MPAIRPSSVHSQPCFSGYTLLTHGISLLPFLSSPFHRGFHLLSLFISPSLSVVHCPLSISRVRSTFTQNACLYHPSHSLLHGETLSKGLWLHSGRLTQHNETTETLLFSALLASGPLPACFLSCTAASSLDHVCRASVSPSLFKHRLPQTPASRRAGSPQHSHAATFPSLLGPEETRG